MARYAASLIFLALMLVAPCVTHAAESYDNCTSPDGQMIPQFITSLPAVITSQGTWCLKQNLTTMITSGAAIEIKANNVTLDCNDFKLGGLGAGVDTQAIGVFAVDRLNVTVRHCNIRGFFRGIYFYGNSGGGHLVEYNRFDGNTQGGIYLGGDASAVRRNQVFDTGGSRVLTTAVGIATFYSSVDVIDNRVSGVMSTGESFANGITGYDSPGGRIIGNVVDGLVKGGTGGVYGIFLGGKGRYVLRDNDLLGDASSAGYGMFCNNSDTHASAKENVISGFATAMFNCSDAGGNFVLP